MVFVDVNEKYKTRYDEGRIKTTNSAGKARSAWITDIYLAIKKIYENLGKAYKIVRNEKEMGSVPSVDEYFSALHQRLYDENDGSNMGVGV